MITSSGSNYLITSSFLPYLTSEQQERKLSCFVVSCLPSLALSSACLSSPGPNSTCFSHVGILFALASVQLIFRSSLSLDENFVIKTILSSDFVVASVYHCPRIKDKFPNYALCVHLPIKFYEERKPAAVTTTEGRDWPVKRSTHHC